jgi:hypothetical protein
MKQTSRILGLLVVGIVALASCGDDSSDESSVTPDAVAVTASTPFVDPERVVLAGLLLTVGDVDRAVAEGLVNPMEVDAAVSAIDDGNMREWVAIASTD